MSEHHDHRDDCPFKFATLDVCDCVEKNMLDRIEALTKQLAAARQDAKAAEDELEMQEQEGCMMENDYIKLEKERDALRSALSRIRPVPERILRGIPVRDLAETLAEADSALSKGESHE